VGCKKHFSIRLYRKYMAQDRLALYAKKTITSPFRTIAGLDALPSEKLSTFVWLDSRCRRQ